MGNSCCGGMITDGRSGWVTANPDCNREPLNGLPDKTLGEPGSSATNRLFDHAGQFQPCWHQA